jgi:hypothetical protein
LDFVISDLGLTAAFDFLILTRSLGEVSLLCIIAVDLRNPFQFWKPSSNRKRGVTHVDAIHCE